MDEVLKEEFLDRNTKHIDFKDGNEKKGKIKFSQNPLGYKNTNGDIIGISTTPFIESTSGSYVNPDNALKSLIKNNPAENDNVFFTTDEGFRIKINLQDIAYTNSVEEDIIDTPSQSNNYQIVNKEGKDSVLQSNVFDGVTDSYEIGRGMIKKNIYIDKPFRDSNIEAEHIKIRHKITLNHKYQFSTRLGNISKDFKTPREVKIQSLENENLIKFKEPTLDDKNNKKLGIFYEVKVIDEYSFYLNYVIPVDELVNIEYPIIIDPTTSISHQAASNVDGDFITKTWPDRNTAWYPHTVNWSAYMKGDSPGTYDESGRGRFWVYNDTGSNKVYVHTDVTENWESFSGSYFSHLEDYGYLKIGGDNDEAGGDGDITYQYTQLYKYNYNDLDMLRFLHSGSEIIKVYNGSSWVRAEWFRYNGSSWDSIGG